MDNLTTKPHEVKQSKIVDLLVHRLTIYGRMLAGHGLAFPTDTIAAYSRLDPALIRDDRARAYLDALAERRGDLEQAEAPEALAQQVATDSGALYELIGWTIDAAKSGRDPGEIAGELQRIVIAYGVLSDMQNEAVWGEA